MQIMQLNLCYGIQPAPAYPFLAEPPATKLNLLEQGGFVLQARGWIPQIAPVKNGGIFADNPLTDGSQLIYGAADNVTETITLYANSTTLETRAALLKTLYRYTKLARDFWTQDISIAPVYLEWQAPGAPGAQYALVSTIEIADNTEPFSDTSSLLTGEIVITLSREPYWRGIAPGNNPQEWTFYRLGRIPGVDYQYDDMNLLAGSGANIHFATGTVANVREWSSTAYAANLTENWIDIPGENIAGDAPALVCLSYGTLNQAGTAAGTVYVGRTVGEELYTNAGTRIKFDTFNAGDATAGTDTTKPADTGAPRNASATRQRGEVSFATTTPMTTRLTWDFSNSPMDVTLNRGNYAVFMRARQVGGTANTVTARVRYFQDTSSRSGPAYVVLPTATMTIDGVVGNTGSWPVFYMGTLRIPLNGAANMDVTTSQIANSDLTLELQAARSGGAGVLYISDIILIPYDLEMVKCSINLSPTSPLFDNTGYATRAKPNATLVDARSAYEFTGANGLTLTPGVDNRLVFLALGTNNLSFATRTDGQVAVNIVPRWSGVRDV